MDKSVHLPEANDVRRTERMWAMRPGRNGGYCRWVSAPGRVKLGSSQSSQLRHVMNQVNPSAFLSALARRYSKAEDADFPDLFLIVLCTAGGLATGGVVLLAYIPTHAGLLVAYALAVATTLAVLLTIVAMVNAPETASEGDPATAASEEVGPTKTPNMRGRVDRMSAAAVRRRAPGIRASR